MHSVLFPCEKFLIFLDYKIILIVCLFLISNLEFSPLAKLKTMHFHSPPFPPLHHYPLIYYRNGIFLPAPFFLSLFFPSETRFTAVSLIISFKKEKKGFFFRNFFSHPDTLSWRPKDFPEFFFLFFHITKSAIDQNISEFGLLPFYFIFISICGISESVKREINKQIFSFF